MGIVRMCSYAIKFATSKGLICSNAITLFPVLLPLLLILRFYGKKREKEKRENFHHDPYENSSLLK